MSTEENKALIQRLYAEMDRRKEAPIELYGEGFTLALGGAPMDSQAAAQFATLFYTAFPDLSHTITDMVAEGNKVAASLVARGTHQAELMGIPATGRPVEVPIIGIFRIGQGKVLKQEGVFDQMIMLQQLGVMPAPQATSA